MIAVTIHKFIYPWPIALGRVISPGLLGILLNAASEFIIKAANLHLTTDVCISAAIIPGGVLMCCTALLDSSAKLAADSTLF